MGWIGFISFFKGLPSRGLKRLLLEGRDDGSYDVLEDESEGSLS